MVLWYSLVGVREVSVPSTNGGTAPWCPPFRTDLRAYIPAVLPVHGHTSKTNLNQAGNITQPFISAVRLNNISINNGSGSFSILRLYNVYDVQLSGTNHIATFTTYNALALKSQPQSQTGGPVAVRPSLCRPWARAAWRRCPTRPFNGIAKASP